MKNSGERRDIMKAVIVTKPGEVEYGDVPVREIKSYECLVKNSISGFCNGTDVKIIEERLGSMTTQHPFVLGHEAVGIVAGTGSKVRNYKTGDIVLGPITAVKEDSGYNSMWGNMAEYGIVQDHEVMDELGIDRSLYKGVLSSTRIPADIGISMEDLSLVRNLRENLCALKNLGIKPGMDILVYGDGPAGFGLVDLMNNMGVENIAVIGRIPARLGKMKKEAGATTVLNLDGDDMDDVLGNRKFDTIIDAVGSIENVKNGARRLKPGGKVFIYGVLKPCDSTLPLLELPNYTCVQIGSFPYREKEAHHEVIEMVLDGRLDLKKYYSHVIDMTMINEAVRLVKSYEAFKVLFKL